MLVVIVYPYMIVFLFFAIWLMSLVLKKSAAPQRECLRMDSIYRGPIHSQFAMIVNGLVTLRSYERTKYFRQHFMNDLEKSSNVTWSYHSILRWMGMSLDCICLLFSLCATAFAILMKGSVSVELLAFTI